MADGLDEQRPPRLHEPYFGRRSHDWGAPDATASIAGAKASSAAGSEDGIAKVPLTRRVPLYDSDELFAAVIQDCGVRIVYVHGAAVVVDGGVTAVGGQ
jgi:hypothetical protein